MSEAVNLIQQVFESLERHYGYYQWWPSDDHYEIMLGAILVQNTNWRNAEQALLNLGKPLDPKLIASLSLEELAQAIRPSGYYNQKAKRLKALTEWFAGFDYRIDALRAMEQAELRKQLLAINGIGGETADVILVYAVGKPSFVIDAYARRIFERVGLDVPKSYEAFRSLVEQAIEPDTQRYAHYHGLMVDHGQQFCNPTPKCDACPLNRLCALGRTNTCK